MRVKRNTSDKYKNFLKFLLFMRSLRKNKKFYDRISEMFLKGQYFISVDNSLLWHLLAGIYNEVALLHRWSNESLDFFHGLNIIRLQAYQVSALAIDYNRLHTEKYFALPFGSCTCLCTWIWNSFYTPQIDVDRWKCTPESYNTMHYVFWYFVNPRNTRRTFTIVKYYYTDMLFVLYL